MNVTIIAALQEELDAFRGAHDLTPVSTSGLFPAFRFRHRAADVTLLRGGVGKANAAMVAQYAVDHFRPDYLIMTGIAGGLGDRLALGDVVVSRDCVQHDLDVTALGFPLGQVPFTEHRFLAADARLVELALATPVPGQQVVAGRILTGDQFITAADAARQERLRSLHGDRRRDGRRGGRAGGNGEPRAVRDHPLGVRPRRRRRARRLRRLAAPRRRQLPRGVYRHPARPYRRTNLRLNKI